MKKQIELHAVTEVQNENEDYFPATLKTSPCKIRRRRRTRNVPNCRLESERWLLLPNYIYLALLFYFRHFFHIFLLITILSIHQTFPLSPVLPKVKPSSRVLSCFWNISTIKFCLQSNYGRPTRHENGKFRALFGADERFRKVKFPSVNYIKVQSIRFQDLKKIGNLLPDLMSC